MADCLSPKLKLGRPRRPAFPTFSRTSPLGVRLREILRGISEDLDLQPSPFTLTQPDPEKLRWNLRIDLNQVQALYNQRMAAHLLEVEASKEKRRKAAEERSTPEYKARMQARREQSSADRKARKRVQRQKVRDREKQQARVHLNKSREEEQRYGRMLRDHELAALAAPARENVLKFQDFSFWTRHDLPRWRAEDPRRIPVIRLRDMEEPVVPHPCYAPIPIKRQSRSWGAPRWSPGAEQRAVARDAAGMHLLDFGRRIPPCSTAS